MIRGPMFIPLRRQWFEAFRDGSKRNEWRAYGPRWNRQKCHRGRRVILSLGYSGARLRGSVVKTRCVRADLAPAGARAIYPSARYLCAIHVALDSEGIPRN
jgi:hypothetical protein